MLFFIVRFLLWLPARILLPTKVINKQNLKQKNACIYTANHQSMLDAVVLFVRLKFSTYYMAKYDIFKNRLMGAFFKSLHTFPVNRHIVDIKAVKMVDKIISKNNSLMIFPQGKRLKTNDDFSNVKNGAVYFAIKYKLPLIPMFFVKKPKIFHFNRLIVGEPLSFEEFYDQKLTSELLNKATQKYIDKMNELKPLK